MVPLVNIGKTLGKAIVKCPLSLIMSLKQLLTSKSFFITIAILAIYSGILFTSEIVYRLVFAIPPLNRYVESYFIIFGLLALYYFSKYKITRIIILIFYFLCVVANNVHYQIYQNWINAINYFLMFKEASEVTHAGIAMYKMWLPSAIWGIVEVGIFASIAYFRQAKSAIADGIFFAAIIYISAASFITGRDFAISPRTNYSRIKMNYFSLGYFLGRTLPYEWLHLSAIPKYSHPTPPIKTAPLIKNIVLIMGESESATHVSFFGYPRETTPFFRQLSQEQPSAIIMQSYSGGMLTHISLPVLFNAIPHPNGWEQITKGYTNLFNLAKQQQYRTFFFTSQPTKQMAIMNLIGQRWIDTLRYPTDEGYGFNDVMPDKKLLPHLYDIDLDNGLNFVVLHQRGSHVVYGEALTEEEKVFKGETPVDNYDSTIHQTDVIIRQAYEYLSKRKEKDWILLYTSDHGQYVTNKVQNQGTAQYADNYTVPLMIFTPDTALQGTLAKTFNSCQMAFHQQLSTFLIHTMGYDMPISGCDKGAVSGNVLSGDAGYFNIRADGQIQYISPSTHR